MNRKQISQVGIKEKSMATQKINDPLGAKGEMKRQRILDDEEFKIKDVEDCDLDKDESNKV